MKGGFYRRVGRLAIARVKYLRWLTADIHFATLSIYYEYNIIIENNMLDLILLVVF